MSKFATVVIPFAYTRRWGQIVISSLKKWKNERDFDILVMNNSPEVDAIKVITDTELGEGVKVHTPSRPEMRWHGGSLDTAISMVETPYFFSLETDCTIEKDGWLDWYAEYLQDEYTAMVGWYWQQAPDVDDERHYINSSATLYRTALLRRLWKECTENRDEAISYGMNCEKRMNHERTMQMISNGEIGPFSDSRGFFMVDYPYPKPDKWWMEPGAWLYGRVKNQYQCIKVPGRIIMNPQGMQPEYNHNYYGDLAADPYVKHHWGGSVSHNYEKQMVSVQWEKEALEWWLRRENDLWEQWVPEDVREHSLREGLVPSLEEEIAYAKSRTEP